ncbi:hypothetical protein D1871_11265 [Nakamurella silvestris]|nr:hypothetical protein D1871_11265 [Nakamurella silvestris]
MTAATKVQTELRLAPWVEHLNRERLLATANRAMAEKDLVEFRTAWGMPTAVLDAITKRIDSAKARIDTLDNLLALAAGA